MAFGLRVGRHEHAESHVDPGHQFWEDVLAVDRAHRLDAFGRKDPSAAEVPLVRQHLAELRIVGGVRDETFATEVRLAVGVVVQFVEEICVTLEVADVDVEGLEASSAFRIEHEARLGHAERLEDRLREVGAEGTPGKHLDQTAEDRLVDAVAKIGSWIEVEGVGRRRLAELLEVLELGLALLGLVMSRWNARNGGVVGIAGPMRHEVDDPQRGLRGSDRVAVPDGEIGEARDVLRDGVVPVEETLLVQRHHGHDRDRLRHRPDGKQRLLGDVAIALASGISDGPMNELTVETDQDDVAPGHFVLDERFLHGRQALDEVGVERFFGRLGRDGAGQGECAGDGDEQTSWGGEHDRIRVGEFKRRRTTRRGRPIIIRSDTNVASKGGIGH